jgi:hypothetical protein
MTASDASPEDSLPADLVAGVHRLGRGPATDELLPRLEQAGWGTAVVDLTGAVDKAGVMDALVAGLRLPTWFGRNWDALDDALGDLSWWPSGHRGRAIVIRGISPTSAIIDGQDGMLGDVLETATDRWADTDTPLVALLVD